MLRDLNSRRVRRVASDVEGADVVPVPDPVNREGWLELTKAEANYSHHCQQDLTKTTGQLAVSI